MHSVEEYPIRKMKVAGKEYFAVALNEWGDEECQDIGYHLFTIVCSEKEKEVSEEKIQQHINKFQAILKKSGANLDEYDVEERSLAFVDYLESKGYVVFQAPFAWCVAN